MKESKYFVAVADGSAASRVTLAEHEEYGGCELLDAGSRERIRDNARSKGSSVDIAGSVTGSPRPTIDHGQDSTDLRKLGARRKY